MKAVFVVAIVFAVLALGMGNPAPAPVPKPNPLLATSFVPTSYVSSLYAAPYPYYGMDYGYINPWVVI